MWHFKTKMGTFWILDKSSAEYVLGFENEPLKIYSDKDKAMADVQKQQTGFIEWDANNRVRLPKQTADWVEGQPDGWDS